MGVQTFPGEELFAKLEKHLGVQFVYQSPPSPEEKGPGEPGLRAGDLAGLPRDWHERFLRAVKRGRTRQMHDLIEEIRPEFGDAARALTDLIHLYKFETLITVASEAASGIGKRATRSRRSEPSLSHLLLSSAFF